MPGMTTGKALQAQPQTARGAIPVDSIQSVHGAGRVKTTGWGLQRGKKGSIKANARYG